MSFGKGSNTTTTTQMPNAQAMSAYSSLLERANQVASTPYQAYTGELTAPINAQQQAGIGNINSYWNAAQPGVAAGTGMMTSAGTAIDANDISRYMDPYTQSVINATQADFDVQNQRANSTVTGNAAAAGALGGDRVGVAQALTQESQNRTQAPIIAGLRSQGYQSAVQTAENEKMRQGQMGSGIVNASVAGQNAGLSGATAQLGAGTLEQQTQQAYDTALYNQWKNMIQYPYAQTQWLAGLQTGVGSQMGRTAIVASR